MQWSERGSSARSRGWALLGYADIGAGGADLTYQGMAGANWSIRDRLTAKAGYRRIFWDYEKRKTAQSLTWGLAGCTRVSASASSATPNPRKVTAMRYRTAMFVLAAMVGLQASAPAQENEETLARQLTNPVAALISVPLQLNYNSDIGPADDGEQWLLNIQPVIPFSLNDDWNLISRTILPVVDQCDIFPGAGSQTGLGDTVQSLFLSPAAPTAAGLIWGAGPVFLLPTGTDDMLTADKWGMGPTAVALRQQGPWTAGALANHIWSVAGESDRDEVSNTFLQPFLSYTTPTAWTYTLQSESTYDWENSDWQVPLRGVVSKVTRLGDQLVSIGGGVHYWLESPDRGPEGWGFRFTLTLLFPR